MFDVAFKIFIITNCLFWSFWLNIVKLEVNLCYKYCSNLFRNLKKESEFRQYHCPNSTKVGERNFWFSATSAPKFLLPIPAARVGARSVSVHKENQMWQWHCWNRKKKLTIVAMPLPKMGRKKNSGCQNHMWGIKKKMLRL